MLLGFFYVKVREKEFWIKISDWLAEQFGILLIFVNDFLPVF